MPQQRKKATKLYDVSATVTISLHGKVEAESKKQAVEKASMMTLPSLCYQCSDRGGITDEEWSLNGELDGEPQNIQVDEE